MLDVFKLKNNRLNKCDDFIYQNNAEYDFDNNRAALVYSERWQAVGAGLTEGDGVDLALHR